jgi:CRISPR type III-A-associated RAMP protein Csm5
MSPLHIGNGEILSPYTDYIYDDKNGTIYVMDKRKIEAALFELENNETVLDEYINKLINIRGGHVNYSLKQFLEEHQIDYKSLAKVIIKTNADIKFEEIHEQLKSASRPYIPGSSIKGAIRTALLFHHRKQSGYSIDQALVDLFGDKSLKKDKAPNGEDIFGKTDKDILKFLHVSDTTFLKPNEVEVVKTFRFDLNKKSGTIPITLEVIPEGKKLEFRLQCKARSAYHSLEQPFSYLFENQGGEKKILQLVNQFTKYFLESELRLLQKQKIKELDGLISFYERLLNTAEQFEKEQNGAVLRLGSGKTFLDNTITNLFSQDDLNQLRKKLRLGTYHPFPKTRSVIYQSNEYRSPLGWVYVSFST